MFGHKFRMTAIKLRGLGRAAVCDCGTPWTFLLPFFRKCFTKFMVMYLCLRSLVVKILFQLLKSLIAIFLTFI